MISTRAHAALIKVRAHIREALAAADRAAEFKDVDPDHVEAAYEACREACKEGAAAHAAAIEEDDRFSAQLAAHTADAATRAEGAAWQASCRGKGAAAP